jgi:very-short-patch-repair endonuclease
MASRNAKFEDEFSFQCRAYKLPPHVRQFPFANSLDIANPRRRYRADVCFPDYWLMVEIDGAIWQKGGGGHSHPTGIIRGMKKLNDAALWGYSMIRFTTDEVTSGHAIGFTQKVLFAKGWRQNAKGKATNVA